MDPDIPAEAAEVVGSASTSSETIRRGMAALGERHRFALAVTLLQGAASVGELTARFGWPQSLVSHHLAALRKAGLAAVERDGRRRFYRLAAPRHPGLRALLEIFRKAAREDGADGAPPTRAGARPVPASTGSPVQPRRPRAGEARRGRSGKTADTSPPEMEDYLL